MAEKGSLMMSVSGVRGIVGDSLTPELLVQLSAAFAAMLKNKGTVIIGRDSRNSGPHISQLVSATLTLSGMDVIDIGLVPTPTVQLFVEKKRAKGGIVVTASHNPIQWNALKLIKQDGTFLSKNEAEELFFIYRARAYTYMNYQKIGAYQEDFTSYKMHIDAALAQVDKSLIMSSAFPVLIDSVGGAGSVITPLLLQELGCQVFKHNCEVTGDFPRGSEPTVDNIRATGKAVREKKCVIGFCQDPDADRLALINENGEPIGEELTLALAVKQKLSKGSGAVVVNLSTSRVVEDIAEKASVPFFRAPVGEINVVDMMKEKKAFIGGEGNGGVIDPAVHLGRDSLVGIALILELMAVSKKSLSQLVAELPVYSIVKKAVPLSGGITFDEKKAAIKNSLAHLKGDWDERDGLHLNLPSERAWVHIRSSNTEPIVRIIAESPEERRALELIAIVEKLIQ